MRGINGRAWGGQWLRMVLVALTVLGTPLSTAGAAGVAGSSGARVTPPPSAMATLSGARATPIAPVAAARRRTVRPRAASTTSQPIAASRTTTRRRLSSRGAPAPGTRWFFAAQRFVTAVGERVTVRQELAILNPNAVAVPVTLALYPRGAPAGAVRASPTSPSRRARCGWSTWAGRGGI